MNRYHQNHEDPEIREKYSSWQKAYGDYKARARGFNSQEALDKYDEERKKPSIADMLKAIGSSVMRGVAMAKSKSSKAARGKRQNIRKTGGTRGS